MGHTCPEDIGFLLRTEQDINFLESKSVESIGGLEQTAQFRKSSIDWLCRRLSTFKILVGGDNRKQVGTPFVCSRSCLLIFVVKVNKCVRCFWTAPSSCRAPFSAVGQQIRREMLVGCTHCHVSSRLPVHVMWFCLRASSKQANCPMKAFCKHWMSKSKQI